MEFTAEYPPEYGGEGFECEDCGQSRHGERWFCEPCMKDICPKCLPGPHQQRITKPQAKAKPAAKPKPKAAAVRVDPTISKTTAIEPDAAKLLDEDEPLQEAPSDCSDVDIDGWQCVGCKAWNHYRDDSTRKDKRRVCNRCHRQDFNLLMDMKVNRPAAPTCNTAPIPIPSLMPSPTQRVPNLDLESLNQQQNPPPRDSPPQPAVTFDSSTETTLHDVGAAWNSAALLFGKQSLSCAPENSQPIGESEVQIEGKSATEDDEKEKSPELPRYLTMNGYLSHHPVVSTMEGPPPASLACTHHTCAPPKRRPVARGGVCSGVDLFGDCNEVQVGGATEAPVHRKPATKSF